MSNITITASNIEAIQLAEAVYSRRVDANADFNKLNDNISADPAFKNYNVEVIEYEDGDVIYKAVNKFTNEIYIVARGTDEILEEGVWGNPAQWGTIASSGSTLLGEKMTALAEQISLAEGVKVHLAGHSLGGHAAEIAKIRPKAVIGMNHHCRKVAAQTGPS